MNIRTLLEKEVRSVIFPTILSAGFRDTIETIPAVDDQESNKIFEFRRIRNAIELLAIHLHGHYAPGFILELAQLSPSLLTEATKARASSHLSLSINMLEYDYRFRVHAQPNTIKWFRVWPWNYICGRQRAVTNLVGRGQAILTAQVFPWFEGAQEQPNIEQ